MRIQRQQLAAAVLLIAGANSAQAQIYKVVLSGTNEIPAVTTAGSGTAVISLNTTTHEMRVSANFKDLIGNTTASHVHCCVVQPANAGVATTTPTFVGFPVGVRAGAWDNTYNMTAAGTWNASFITANGGTPAGAEAAFVAGVAAGRSYLNVHSSTSPGGEIRGTLILHSFVPAASTRTGSLANALNSLGAGTGAVSDKLVGLAMLGTAEQKAAMEQLMPASSFAVQTTTSNTLFVEFDQMGSRMQGLRMAPDSDSAGTATAINGFWAKAVSITAEQNADEGAAGFDNEGWDLALGYDRQLSPGLVVGAAVNIADNSLDFHAQSAGSNTDISTTQFSLYGTQQMGKGYLEGMVAFGQHDSDYQRNAGVAGLARAQADSDQMGARIGGGFTTALGSTLTMTPQARLDWSSLDQDGYQETGGGGLALKVASQSFDRMRTSIGAQLDWVTGSSTSPFIRGFWNHDLKDDRTAQVASFVNGGTSFVDSGQRIDNSSYSLGAGLNFHGRNGMSAAIAYDMSSSDNYDAEIFHAKLYWAF